MGGEAGTTLVEMMIALAVLAMLSAGLYQELHIGMRAWNGAEEHAEGADTTVQVRTFLSRELEQAYPAYSADDPTHPSVFFQGAPDRLSFLAPAPASLLDGGQAELSLSVEPRNGLLRFGLEAHRPGTGQPARDLLLDRVQSVSFAYFGADRPRDTPQWRDSWSGMRGLPRLVRIRLAFPAGDPRRWPDLVVAPRLAADADCVFDPQTRYCRGR